MPQPLQRLEEKRQGSRWRRAAVWERRTRPWCRRRPARRGGAAQRCASRYFFAEAFFAIRDFCRAALFLWMMPRAAALSSADAAANALVEVESWAEAFLTSVFNLDLTARFRMRLFSDARVHFMAALILGTNRSSRLIGKNP